MFSSRVPPGPIKEDKVSTLHSEILRIRHWNISPFIHSYDIFNGRICFKAWSTNSRPKSVRSHVPGTADAVGFEMLIRIPLESK